MDSELYQLKKSDRGFMLWSSKIALTILSILPARPGNLTKAQISACYVCSLKHEAYC